MNRLGRMIRLKKIASQAGSNAAKGVNWFLNETAYNEADITAILGITLDSGFNKITTREEKQFLELGWYLTKDNNGISSNLSSIKDYLTERSVSLIKDYRWFDDGNKEKFLNKQSIVDQFNKLVNDAKAYNLKKEESKLEKGKDVAVEDYKSDVVKYKFGDGWRVVYLPAAGEMESYLGQPQTSHDRIVEGNKNGLCLGSGDKLYQNNSEGKVYSLRDPDNNPKVTFRIRGTNIEELKGKYNRPPDIESSKHAKDWLSILGLKLNPEIEMELPPTTIEEVKKRWSRNRLKFLRSPWAHYWYKAGLEEFDEAIKNYVDAKSLITMGLVERNPLEFSSTVQKEIETNDLLSMDVGIYTPIWKIYKDKGWMREAVKSAIESSPTEAFKKELFNIKNYEDYFLVPSKANPSLNIFENELLNSKSLALVDLSGLVNNPKFSGSISQFLKGQSPEDVLKNKDLAKKLNLNDLLKSKLQALSEKNSIHFFTNIELSEELGLVDLVKSKIIELSKKDPIKFLLSIKTHSSPIDFLSRSGLTEITKGILEDVSQGDMDMYLRVGELAVSLGYGNLTSKVLQRYAIERPILYLKSLDYMNLAEKLGLKDLTKDTLIRVIDQDPKQYFNLDNFTYDSSFNEVTKLALESMSNLDQDYYLSEDDNKYPNLAKDLGINNINKKILDRIIRRDPEEYFNRELDSLASNLGLPELNKLALEMIAINDKENFLDNYSEKSNDLGFSPDEIIKNMFSSNNNLIINKLISQRDYPGVIRKIKELDRQGILDDVRDEIRNLIIDFTKDDADNFKILAMSIQHELSLIERLGLTDYFRDQFKRMVTDKVNRADIVLSYINLAKELGLGLDEGFREIVTEKLKGRRDLDSWQAIAKSLFNHSADPLNLDKEASMLYAKLLKLSEYLYSYGLHKMARRVINLAK